MEAGLHLGTEIVYRSQSQSQLQTTEHTHTHTHTVLIDLRQKWNSGAGVPSPFHDLIHNFQRSKFKQFRTQPSKCCSLTLKHVECKHAAGDRTFSALGAAEHRSGTSGWRVVALSGHLVGLCCSHLTISKQISAFSRLQSKVLSAHLWRN